MSRVSKLVFRFQHSHSEFAGASFGGKRLAADAAEAPAQSRGNPHRKFKFAAFVLFTLVGSFVCAPARADTVDLLLVLAADVSRSVDANKFQLQRNGYAAAITDRRVLDAIKSGPHGRIGVAFVEWSGAGAQKVIIDWTAIGDMKSAQEFSGQIVEAQRPFADRTSISGGIDFAMAQFDRAPFQSARHTIDVSGDGTNNSGRDVVEARDDAVAKGVTINGLVILSETPLSWNADHTNPPGGLANYYRNNVIGGSGAFVMVAQNFDSFGQAIINKLIAEIAAVPASRTGSALDERADAHDRPGLIPKIQRQFSARIMLRE